MNPELILSFTIMVAFLTMMPGPNGALLLRTVPMLGRRAGVLNLVGIIIAFLLHGAFSIFGLSAIILSSSKVFFLIKTLGAIYLAYLGIISLWKAFEPEKKAVKSNIESSKTKERSSTNRVLEGLLTNLLNPKVSLFYMAAFPQFIDFSKGFYADAFVLVLIHILIVIAWFAPIILAIASATKFTKTEKFRRAIQGITGTLFLWFGYKILKFEQDAQ